MNPESGLHIRRGLALAIAAALLLTGAASAYLMMRVGAGGRENTDVGAPSSAPGTLPPQAAAAGSVPAPASDAPLADVIVPIGLETIARAGIVSAPVSTAPDAPTIRLPGVVEPNAYKQVIMTPLVSGRIMRVSAELGNHVKRGQTLVQIYSPELAEAQTRYMSARAMLDAHDRELQRAERLVEIGAASRQELDRIHAEHTAQGANLESARSRLLLLGVPAATIDEMGPGKKVDATASVFAPMDGVITERLANVGLNVDSATKLFTVVDLATVWVVADLYERDFSHVQVGTSATITTAAYPNRILEGRVSYIDPQVAAATRTAKVRVEVPNPRGELRLGMYANVLVRASGAETVVMIPRSAVQQVGDRQFVYLVKPGVTDKFVEHEIRLGSSSGPQADVISGLQPGDVIVTEGSFFVRAERERLGLRPLAPTPASNQPTSSSDRPSQGPDMQTARVTIGELGFDPSSLTLRKSVPAQITFVRTTDKTCAKEIVFPSLNLRRALPLNQPVVVEIPPQKEDLTFVCGMDMLRGTIVVQ